MKRLRSRGWTSTISASASIVSSRFLHARRLDLERVGRSSSARARRRCDRVMTPRFGTIGTIAMRFVSASVLIVLVLDRPAGRRSGRAGRSEREQRQTRRRAQPCAGTGKARARVRGAPASRSRRRVAALRQSGVKRRRGIVVSVAECVPSQCVRARCGRCGHWSTTRERAATAARRPPAAPRRSTRGSGAPPTKRTSSTSAAHRHEQHGDLRRLLPQREAQHAPAEVFGARRRATRTRARAGRTACASPTSITRPIHHATPTPT